MDKSEFLKIFSVMSAAFPHSKPTPETVEVYYLTLRDLPEDILKAACLKALTDSEFLPTIAKIRTCAVSLMCGERRSGGEAWGEMIRGLRTRIGYGMPAYADPLITRAVNSIGWDAVRMADDDDFATRAQFIKVYDALAERARTEARELPQVSAVSERYKLGAPSETVRRLAEKLSVKQ